MTTHPYRAQSLRMMGVIPPLSNMSAWRAQTGTTFMSFISPAWQIPGTDNFMGYSRTLFQRIYYNASNQTRRKSWSVQKDSGEDNQGLCLSTLPTLARSAYGERRKYPSIISENPRFGPGSSRIQVWRVKASSSRSVNVAEDLKINHAHLFPALLKTQESSCPFPSYPTPQSRHSKFPTHLLYGGFQH